MAWVRQVREWRRRFGKPVIVDECGYEGDLDQGWGFLTAEELVSRSWAVTMSGGYVTHGETYYSDDETVFWAKGGRAPRREPARLAFLRQIIEESPDRQDRPTAVGFRRPARRACAASTSSSTSAPGSPPSAP